MFGLKTFDTSLDTLISSWLAAQESFWFAKILVLARWQLLIFKTFLKMHHQRQRYGLMLHILCNFGKLYVIWFSQNFVSSSSQMVRLPYISNTNIENSIFYKFKQQLNGKLFLANRKCRTIIVAHWIIPVTCSRSEMYKHAINMVQLHQNIKPYFFYYSVW